jgi:uncharacterized membrane protein
MLKVEKSIVIKRPVADVFAYAYTTEYATQWQGGVESIILDNGPDNTVGSRYTEVRKFLGQEMKTQMEVTAYVPNARWAAKVVKGPIPYEVEMTYTAVPDGTKLHMVVEGEMSGFFKLAEGMVASQLAKSIDEDLQHLKTLLEDK